MDNNWVGYYPGSMFDTTGLRTYGSVLHWYGEIVDIGDNENSYTDMGSGHFASEGYGKAAWMRLLKYWSTGDVLTDYRTPITTVQTPGQYSVAQNFDNTGSWGSYMFYGGPGR